ncbi:MAG TPA: hypothetical protein VD948_02810 [Rhodothermales bacterium]|nr:hypothetical protein [Rhodothermales bacterium]
MPKVNDSFEIPALLGGLNRFEAQSKDGELAEALDVIATEDELRRRDGFKTIATAAPHVLPAAATTFLLEDAGGASYTTRTARTIPVGSSAQAILIGAEEKFDGIDWRRISNTIVPLANIGLAASYSNGLGWTTFQIAHDSTVLVGATYHQPLSRDGRISWHRSQLTSWALQTYNGFSRYWIRIALVLQSSGSAIRWDNANVVIPTHTQPGAKAVILSPVNGIVPVRFKASQSALVIGSDRDPPRGSELGAQLGIRRDEGAQTERLFVVGDEGGANYGQITQPTTQESTAAPASWSNSAGQPAAATWGTANVLKKTLEQILVNGVAVDYDWRTDMWAGDGVLTSLSDSGSSTASVLNITEPTRMTLESNRFEGYRLIVTTGGGGGPAANEVAEVYKHTDNGATWSLYHSGFTAAPVASTRFKLRPPPAQVKLLGQATECYDVKSNDADGITLDTNTYAAAAPSDGPYLFEVGRPVPWAVEAGEKWSHAYEPGTGVLFLANGRSPILAYDGRRLRIFEADTTSRIAIELEGKFTDDGSNMHDPNAHPAARLLKFPPIGKFLVDHAGSIFIANLRSRGQDVAWSAPTTGGAIWPLRNRATLRDVSNDEISGLISFAGRLIAFTPSALYEGSYAAFSLNQMNWQPVYRGTGFISHHATCAIPFAGREALIGPAGDGVVLWSGGEPVYILDDWRRIGDVNTRRLKDSCATTLLTQNLYILGLCMKGSGTSNGHMLVIDYQRKTYWVWTAPFGVSSLATQRLPDGSELLLVGTEDGHVMTMGDFPDDDGKTITGYARSRPFRPYKSFDASFSRLVLEAAELGATETMTVRAYLDGSESTALNADITLDDGAAVYGTGVFGTATYAEERDDKVPINFANGTRGHEIQIELRGSSRWRYYGATLQCRKSGHRGR